MTVQDQSTMRAIREQIELGGLVERVHMPGAVSYRDVPAYYRRATLVVNASLTGSVDKVVLEAMAAARPVVSCNESIPPLLAELGDERAALYFTPKNASELADRMEALLARTQVERDALGARLRAIVARDHDVDRLTERLVREMGGAA
jgi:glycosyltransferase involved in cell wall biosynthesis